MTEIFDSHAHYDDIAFDGDREALKVQIDAIRALGDEADIMNGASTLMHCAKFYANKKED